MRKLNKEEYTISGNDPLKIGEHIKRLRTELAYWIRRAELELSSNRAIDYARFEDHIHKIMDYTAMVHKYIMKFLRRTDKNYLPLERLLHPQMLLDGDYYRSSNYSATFSREIEKTFDLETTGSKAEHHTKRVLEWKDIEEMKKMNSRIF